MTLSTMVAYSPKQVLLLGITGCVIFGYALLKGLRTGSFPRRRPLFGKLSPEMGEVISREKHPRAYRRNVVAAAILVAISFGLIVGGVALLFNPDL